MEEHLGPGANMQTLQQAAQAAQEAAMSAAAAAAVRRDIGHHGDPIYHPQERPGNGGMPEPALQADESLMELPEGQETKRCAACRIVKPVSEYYKDRTHSRGIKTRCKQCLRLCKEAFKNQQRAKSAAEQITVESKKCSHCNQEKPAAEFSRSSYQRTGLRSWCKECSSKSKKQAKAEGRWKSYDLKAKQPRKCRKCDELRQPEDFPVDPRNSSKRTRDCQYCLSDLGDMPTAGAQAALEGAQMPVGAWGHPLGDYWQLDPTRAQQLQQGLVAPETFQQAAPASESLMRILRAAMAGGGEEPRRMTPELLSQLGIYADPNDPFSELPPEAQAAVIQQFVDQQQQQHHNALLQGHHPGFGHEALYHREGGGGSGIHFPPGQRPPDNHAVQYAEQSQPEGEEPAEREEEAEADTKEHAQGHTLGVSHFEGLRNLPYMPEGWQPGHQLSHPVPHHPQPLHHPQAHNLLQERNWPSAFAPTQRLQPQEQHFQGSPKRQRTESHD